MNRAPVTQGRRVDAWGRVLYTAEAAAELLLGGHDIATLWVEPGPEVAAYNAHCRTFNKPGHRLAIAADPATSPADTHAQMADRWAIPSEYRAVDVRALLLDRCATDAQRARVATEMALYEARGLVPVLRGMLALVDHMRANKVVWGVGRGSSVASYVLFLIGIIRIDPMLYGLEITEYLR